MNKRPLPCVLAGFVLGEVWIWQFHGTAAWAALFWFAMICFMIAWKKKSSFFLLVAIGLITGGIRQGQWNHYEADLLPYKTGQSCLIYGQIEETERKEYAYSLVLKDVSIEGENYGGKLMVYLEEEPICQIGSRILLEGKIQDFPLSTNPGGFNQRSYRFGKGILGVVKQADVIEVRLGSFLIKDAIYEIRENASSYLAKKMEEDMAGLGIAMALGDKNGLLEEQKELFEFGGISHVLAVSGLHMSLLGAALYKMLRKAGCCYTVSVMSAVPCILIYAVMTGMSSSCLRAAIMLLIYLIAEWKGYYYDLPSALSFAGLWLLYEIPARLFDSGFLLSFGAMLSVGILCPFLFQIFHYETGKRKLRDSFLSGFIIILFTLPLSFYFFYGFSIAGLLLNLIVIPLMTFLVPLLFIGSMGWLWLIPDEISILCIRGAEWILQFYSGLCENAQKLPFLYIQTGYRGLGFAVSYYCILSLFLFVVYRINKKNKKAGFVTGIVFLALLFVFILFTGKNNAYMTFLDVGQGDGILYHSKNGIVCMMDGGSTSEKEVGRYILRPAFEYYGISKVDYWFLSHMDEDHISGAKELLEAGYPISHLILPVRKEKSEKQMELETLAYENGTEIHYMKQGDKLQIREEAFYCLYPEKKAEEADENQNSLVLMLETENQEILLTGDVEYDGEANMTDYLAKYPLSHEKEHILKVAHHGSSNGSQNAFLDIFDPESAIISCSLKNKYGHPAKETLDRLNNHNTAIYYTMNQGAIEIQLGKATSYFGYGVLK